MPKHFLSICAVVKDEKPYLEEWLSWHLIHGVEHFYLYDNGSTDGSQDIYKKYADVVTPISCNYVPCQLPAYDNFIHKYKNQNTWVAFIDVDEFICTTYSSIPRALDFKQKENVAAWALHWVLFGSNGHETKTDGLVIERFTKTAAEANEHVKSIVRMDRVLGVGKDPHSFQVRGDVLDENNKKLLENYAVSGNATAEHLWANHYFTKSREEYLIKSRRPRADNGVRYNEAEVIERFRSHDTNQIEDLWAMEKAGKVREEMRKR